MPITKRKDAAQEVVMKCARLGMRERDQQHAVVVLNRMLGGMKYKINTHLV